MRTSTVLNFNGNCEAAFKFYEQHLGGQPRGVFRYAGSPLVDSVPPEWGDKIMHGSIVVGDHMLMGGDSFGARYEPPKGFTLSLQMSDTVAAERIFDALAEDGKVVMPLEKTFWASRFGMVIDRFGIPWQINCE